MSTENKQLDIIIWGHSDQTGGAELACELFTRFRDFLQNHNRRGDSVGIACPQRCEGYVQRRLGNPTPRIITVEESISIVKTDGSVDPVATGNTLLERFTSADALEGFVQAQVKNIEPHVHDHTLIISCGEPVAVAVAKQLGKKLGKKLGLRCVIITDILLPDAVRRVLEYGGCLFPNAARLLAKFAEWDREADEAYLAPPEFCGSDYDAYFAYGGVPTMSLGGLFYRPALAPEFNSDLRDLQKKAEKDQVVFVFGGGGKLWLNLYGDLAQTLRTSSSPLPYAVLVPDVALVVAG